MWDNSVRYHQSTENANSFYVQISTPPPKKIEKKKERKRENIIKNFNFYKIDRLTQ